MMDDVEADDVEADDVEAGDVEAGDVETGGDKAGGSWKRFLPLGIVFLALGAFFALGGPNYISLESLGEHKEALAAYVNDHLVLSLLLFMGLYMVMTLISFPGAWVLSLLGGFLFGAWLGGAAIVVGATIGASCLFLAARYAIGDFLTKKVGGDHMKKFEEGLKENELSYLFILRLVPIFPFFIVNFVPALFGVKFRNYVLSTFFGIMPGAFVYASVGQGLEAVLAQGGEEGLSGLMTQPKVILPILGLVALSLIPVVYKKIKGNAAEA